MNQTVDVMLALLLLTGAVIGAQFGTKLGAKLRGEPLRGLLALLVLVVCGKLGADLLMRPEDLYSLRSEATRVGKNRVRLLNLGGTQYTKQQTKQTKDINT